MTPDELNPTKLAETLLRTLAISTVPDVRKVLLALASVLPNLPGVLIPLGPHKMALANAVSNAAVYLAKNNEGGEIPILEAVAWALLEALEDSPDSVASAALYDALHGNTTESTTISEDETFEATAAHYDALYGGGSPKVPEVMVGGRNVAMFEFGMGLPASTVVRHALAEWNDHLDEPLGPLEVEAVARRVVALRTAQRGLNLCATIAEDAMPEDAEDHWTTSGGMALRMNATWARVLADRGFTEGDATRILHAAGLRWFKGPLTPSAVIAAIRANYPQ